MDDEAFRALADPTRRILLDRLAEQNGQSLKELSQGLGMARQSVSKHLGILISAGLVTTLRQGRESLHYLDAAPINAIANRWMHKYDRVRAQALTNMKQALEEQPMSTDTFVHTTYVHGTPERVWRALVEPEFTRQYWGIALQSDWQPGSLVVWEFDGVTIADPAQKVIESVPYERLSYTWHSFTAEWAKVFEIDEKLWSDLAAESRSTASFTLEPQDGDVVKLTVVHQGRPGGAVLATVTDGWPPVLSSLKTLLETGKPLP